MQEAIQQPMDVTNAVEPTGLHVLVVAYYFPPMGLSGVQRISKFVKYLPEFDWHPTVLTVKPGGYYAFDPTLLAELENNKHIQIHRTESVDPTRLFSAERSVKMPSERSRKVQSWLSQFLYVPDNKNGWKSPAIEKGKQILASGDFDVIFASAPPYTGLLIGLELSRLSGVPLVSDLRDDWLGNPRHVYPTFWHRRRHAFLETEVMRHSTAVTTVNRIIQDRVINRHFGARGYNLVSWLPQGFDPEDFSAPPTPRAAGKFRFIYCGVFYGAQQPDTFLRALNRWLSQNPEASENVEAHFAGLLPDRVDALIEELNLGNHVVKKGYLTHDLLVHELMKADVPWMTVGRQPGEESIGTGKLYEYFGARKPILGLVPDGAARNALSEYGISEIVDPDDVDGVVAAIDRLYLLWSEGRLPTPDETFIQRHNRKRVTGDLARLFISTLKTE